MEGGDEPDEAEAHDEDQGGADLQPRSVVRVEPQHVAPRAATERAGAGAGGGVAGGGGGATPAHPGSGGGGAAGSDGAGTGGGGGGGLGLRCASGHCWDSDPESARERERGGGREWKV